MMHFRAGASSWLPRGVVVVLGDAALPAVRPGERPSDAAAVAHGNGGKGDGLHILQRQPHGQPAGAGAAGAAPEVASGGGSGGHLRAPARLRVRARGSRSNMFCELSSRYSDATSSCLAGTRIGYSRN